MRLTVFFLFLSLVVRVGSAEAQGFKGEIAREVKSFRSRSHR